MAIEQIRDFNKKKKTRWFIILLILLLLVAILLYLWLYRQATEVQSPVNLNTTVNQQTNTPPTIVNPPVSNPVGNGTLADAQVTNGGTEPIRETEQSALVIASSFAERFGSYSNQSDYQNFNELDVFMTDSLKKWVIQYTEDLKKENPNINIYYAVETKAISTTVNSFDEEAGLSEIMVKTQRQEFNDVIANPRVYYQDLLLKLVKVDDEWKVDGVYWQ